MKKYSSYLLTALVLLVFVAKPAKVRASHAAGGEIVYEWLSDSTYRVFFKFYRDCTGATAPTAQPLCYKNSCNSTIYQTTMQVYPGVIPPGVSNGSPVAGCPSPFSTNCTNPSSTIPGYQEWWYYADVTLPMQCNYWTFYTFIGNRNPSNNIANSTSLFFYTETTFNNTGGFQGNSSPYFSNKPTPYVCVNVPYQFNNGAVDPNGDSLSSDVQQPYHNPGDCSSLPIPAAFNNPQPAPYPNISIPTNPIQTANTFSLNAATGQVTFTAPLLGPQTLSIRTREYRGGVQIGSVLRDVQVQVIGNCSAPAPTLTPISGGPSAPPIVNGYVQGCAGQLLTFGYDLKSPNPSAILIGDDNHNASIPAATTFYNNQKTDSVRGTFSWIPGPNQSGLFNLTVSVRDSTCAPPGIMYTQVYTIPIQVWGKVVASPDTTLCIGSSVAMKLNGAGQFTWTVLSGDANSLSCTTCSQPTAKPNISSKYEVTVSSLPAGCAPKKDTVGIEVIPYHKPSISIAATVSPGFSITFTATTAYCNTPQYQWRINGNSVPNATSATFNTIALANNDIVTCLLTCNDTCIIDTPSNAIGVNAALGINDIGLHSSSLYPNPNNGSFTLGTAPGSTVDLDILNLLGQVVWSQRGVRADASGNIDVQTGSLPEGHYVLKVGGNRQTDVLRFSIQR